MRFPKIEVAYTIIFDNTGLDLTDIQEKACQIIERKYCGLHCVGSKFYEENDADATYVVIKEVPCKLYFKVSEMQIEVVAVKTEFIDAENRKWNRGNPTSSQRELYCVTVNRHEDNHTWVQHMIWDNFSEKWLWRDDPDNNVVDTTKFTIKAWQPLPEPVVEIYDTTADSEDEEDNEW